MGSALAHARALELAQGTGRTLHAIPLVGFPMSAMSNDERREWRLTCENYVWHARVAAHGGRYLKNEPAITVVPKSRLTTERQARDEAIADRVNSERESAEWQSQAEAECRLRESAEDRRDEIQRRAESAEAKLAELERQLNEPGTMQVQKRRAEDAEAIAERRLEALQSIAFDPGEQL
jgi:hypothetical protein